MLHGLKSRSCTCFNLKELRRDVLCACMLCAKTNPASCVLLHNSHSSEWYCEKLCTAAGLSLLILCSNVTSDQVWQMDYLNMWASNHRVQSSNPSDTGPAKHNAEVRDNDPNHDKTVHSSTTAMSRLTPAVHIKRVILARWVCQSEEWKRSKADTSEEFTHRRPLWAHTAMLISSHMNRGFCFMRNLLPQSSDSHAEKNESLKSCWKIKNSTCK